MGLERPVCSLVYFALWIAPASAGISTLHKYHLYKMEMENLRISKKTG